MTADQLNRPSANPGGMECQTCGRIFIGDESHSECGLCHNTRSTAVASHAEGEVVAYLCEKLRDRWGSDDKPTGEKWLEQKITMDHNEAAMLERDFAWTVHDLYTHPPRSGDESDYREIASLIGQIFFYGDFKAETYNERLLEALLRKTGNFHETQQQADAAMAARGDDK